MSAQLRIDAQVTVDASQATAGLASIIARTSDLQVGLFDAQRAVKSASIELAAQEKAARAAGLGLAEMNAQLRPATAALVEAKNAAAVAKGDIDALSASERASASAANAAATAHRAMGSSVGFNRIQLLELGHIGTSLADSLAAGINPLRALAFEGGRIGEVVAGSGGPVKAFGSLVTLLGGPLVLGAVAAAAAIGGVALFLSHAQSEAVKLQRALDASGNQAGVTAADLEAMGNRIATATNTGAGAAIETVGKLATSGKFTREEIEQLGSAAVGLAARTGETADKVTGAFVKMADGPTAYARQFAASYAGLTAATVEHIRQLEETGQKDKAVAVLSKALYDQLGTEAPGKLGFLERAWDAVSGAIGGATRAALAFGRTDTSPTAATNKLAADIQARIDKIKASSSVQRGFGDVSPTSASDVARGYARELSPNQQISVLEQQKAAALGLSAATAAATAAQQAANKVQRDGIADAEDLEKNYGKIGDSALRGAQGVAKFRAELKGALAANPTDPTLLDYQRRAPSIEKDIRDKASPDAAAADKKAATAAAEAEKARAKKQADLAAEIILIQGEATAAGRVKAIREEDVKVLELKKQYGEALVKPYEDQIRAAIRLKEENQQLLVLAEQIQRAAALVELPDPSKIFASQRAAAIDFDRKRETGVEDPQTLEDSVANSDHARNVQRDAERGEKFGESAASRFQSTAATIGGLIGEAFGGKIGGTLSKLVTNAAKGSATDPGGLSVFGQNLQDGFKQFNTDTKHTLGDLFDSVFPGKGAGFGKAVGTAFAGASVGQLSGSIVGALGVKTSNTGSELGGALGGLAFGPIGSIIGGVAGGILGGLFGKKSTSNSDVLTNAVQGTATGSNSIQQTAATGLGSQVTNGLQQIAAALGGTTGTFSPITIGQRNDNYRVDTTGATIGKYNGKDFGTGDAAQAAAVSYAVSVALQRGGVAGLSPEVQKVIAQYGSDLNTAVAEAVKVKNLQDVIADSLNPFATAFQAFELQASQRVAVATQYGFDVVAIEKINATQRAKLIQDTLTQATASVQAAIDDLKYGSRATGSIVEQRASLTAEQQRLQGLVAGGDNTQLGALTQIVQQEVDLNKQAYGSTAAYSTSRDDAVTLLQSLVQQQSDQIAAASASAKAGTTETTPATDPTVAALSTLNATGDDQVALAQAGNGYLAYLPAIAAALAAGGSGGGGSALSASYARTSLK